MKRKVNVYIRKENGKSLITPPSIFKRIWVDKTLEQYETTVDCSAFGLRKEENYIVTPFCRILVKPFDKSCYPYPIDNDCKTIFKWSGSFYAIDKINNVWFLTYSGVFEDYERVETYQHLNVRRTFTKIRHPLFPEFFGLCRLYPFFEKIGISFTIENGISFFLKRGEKVVGHSFVIGSWLEEVCE